MADVDAIPKHLLSTCYGWRVKSKSMAGDVGRTISSRHRTHDFDHATDALEVACLRWFSIEPNTSAQ